MTREHWALVYLAIGTIALVTTFVLLAALATSSVLVHTAENGRERAIQKAEEELYRNCKNRFRVGYFDQACIDLLGR